MKRVDRTLGIPCSACSEQKMDGWLDCGHWMDGWMDGFTLRRDNCSNGPHYHYKGYICCLFFNDGGHWCHTTIKAGIRSSRHTADIVESRRFPEHFILWNHKLTSVICTQLWLFRLMSTEWVFQSQVKDDVRLRKRKTQWINEWGQESLRTENKELMKSSKMHLLDWNCWHNFLC